MPLKENELREVVTRLVSRPGHENVKVSVYELLVHGLDSARSEVDFERAVPEVRGRIDALLGRTVFEFKSDLRREGRDAEEQLARYLADREAATGQRFIGIATDGVTFQPYELRNDLLRALPKYEPSVEKREELLPWLRSVVAVSIDLMPYPEVVRAELGRESLAWQVARADLAGAWRELADHPEAQLKRQLWARLMERVYGAPFAAEQADHLKASGADELFFQHTYLSVVAKTMAVHVLGISLPEPENLLAGRPFQEAGIGGVVESDFFDWTLYSNDGHQLIRRIALQTSRFRLRDIQTDVLKGLYESLVDPEQRHDLGEYYTPDWLAHRICAEVIDEPLQQRVLDPACGSGTFLFQSVRHLPDMADQAELTSNDALEMACRQVIGVDVHPLAVQIARVTYLLALGEERLSHRSGPINIPVYLGDSLQWNTRGFLAEQHVLIEVPGEDQMLEFPFEVARDPALFDSVIMRMLELSEGSAEASALTAWLERDYDLLSDTRDTLARTYSLLSELHRNRKDHIWGFVARNLVRPVWLSQEDQQADVVIGNPPWLPYRFMSAETQERFQEECRRRGIWMGQVAQQQDLSAYFFARSVELYLKPTGAIAFVMPYAALSRRQFHGFRSGFFGTRVRRREEIFAAVRFTDAWSMSNDVQPLFPVPSCVLFAEHSRGEGEGLPETLWAGSGDLPKRDASPLEAEQSLSWNVERWPEQLEGRVRGGYASDFRAGAVVFPRVLFTVNRVGPGRFGANPETPIVESRRTNQEKLPWKTVASLRGNVEAQFVRPLYLGASIAPFRVLGPILSVIPWDETEGRLLDSDSARRSGFVDLGEWLAQAEQLLAEHGTGRRTLMEQLDYYGQLSAQFPVPVLRVVYTASGTLPAAMLLKEQQGLVEHAAYWHAVESESEGLYLAAILNSEMARSRAEHLQSRGQWGARHFDKVMLSLPIPKFDTANALHGELADAAATAQAVANGVELREGQHFKTARRLIREALLDDGVAERIDDLVAQLLDGG